jgi:hypothetical protein
MSPTDHGERAQHGPSGLPRPLALIRWVGWALGHRAFTRHHLLSYLRMARASARCPSLRFEGPYFIGPDVRFEVREGYGRLVLGAYTHVGAHARLRAHEGTLRVGPKSVVGIRNTINCWIDVSIGDACLFGDDVYICDFDHVTASLDLPIKDQGIVKSPVRIGPGSWIGTKVTVLRGTEVGRGSVLAANAVVRGSWPDHSVLGGVPARLLRDRSAVVQPTDQEP